MSRLASRLPAWPFVLLVLAIALLSLFAPYTWRGRFSEPVDIPPAQDAARSPHAVYANASDPATGSKVPMPQETTGDAAAAPGPLAETDPLTFVVTPVPDPDAAPSDAAPSDAAPSDAAPSDAMPSDAAPSDAAPSDAAPSDAAPSDAAPSDTAPSDTAPSDTAPSDTAPSDTAPSDTAPSDAAPFVVMPPPANSLRAVGPDAPGRTVGETPPTASASTPEPAAVPANTPAAQGPGVTYLSETNPAATGPAVPAPALDNPTATDPAAADPVATTPQGTAPAVTAPAASELTTPASEPSAGESGSKSLTGPANSAGDVASDASKPMAGEPAGEKLAEVVDETGVDGPAGRGNEQPKKITDSAAKDPGNSSTPAESVAALPTPAPLVAELRSLSEQGVLSAWADAILARLEQLARLPQLEDPSAPVLLQELGELADQAGPLSLPLGESPERVRVLRAAYGVSRRVAVWDSLCELATIDRSGNEWSLTTSRQLEASQLEVEVHLARSQYRDLWRNYLCLDRAKELVGSMDEPTTRQRDIARMILTRLDVDTLNESQSRFLSHPVFQTYRAALRAYSRQEVALMDIVQLIERYETTLASLDARRVAHGFQALRWSPLESESQAAQPINDHYRNANVRVAISAALINRLLPTEHTSLDPVDDVIHSARVQGTSRTSSRLRVFLVPSRLQWRLGLEARGDVASQTESRKGPATFYQDAMANFDARKHVTVDKRGIRTDRAEARARSSSDLRGLETDFDDIPLFNRLARGIANRQYQEQSPQATAEVESRVAGIASQRLDEEVHNRLSDAEGEFQTRWLMPLRNMGLDPTPIDFETTDQRLIVRYRIAAIHQLAAHTPRPQAPTSSWMSVQLHESAINNTLDQLGLGGRKLTIQELCDELAKKFGRPSPPIPEDIPEDMTVTLAPREGIRVRCDGGQLRLTLRVAELAQNRHSKWRNFTVQTNYEPSPDQRNANLVRNGIIELSSDGKGIGNQFALRAIFSKVLSKNRTISLINHSMAQQPEFADLAINQFVLSDGWIGIAMAPKPNTARIPYRRSLH